MAKEERAKAYLAKAKTAEEQAEKATDPVVKSTWERIAQGYRDLARMPGLWQALKRVNPRSPRHPGAGRRRRYTRP